MVKTLLAPVFDNGNSLNNKIDAEKIELCLKNRDRLIDYAYISTTCIFTKTKKGEERRINPHQEIKNCIHPILKKVVLSITPIIKQKLPLINALIDDIPLSYENIQIITPSQKEFYKSLINIRFSHTLYETYNHLISQKREKNKDNLNIEIT